MKPSELTLTLAALPRSTYGDDDGWISSVEIAHRLSLFGFDATSQQAAAWLRRMARVDAPWVETRERHGYFEYRVTQFGVTDIRNKLPNVQLRTPWLPIYRRSAA